MRPTLGAVIALLLGGRDNAVESFHKLTDRTPTCKEVQEALRESDDISLDGRLAKAYYKSLWHSRDEGLSRLIRFTRYASYGESTVEAVPYAVEHLAKRGIFAPLAATMRWPWDGAPAEVIGDIYWWFASQRPSEFSKMYTAQTPATKRRVVVLIAGANVMKGPYAPELLRRATAKHDQTLIRFWRAVMKQPD